MNNFDNGTYTGERALYNIHNASINNSIFEDGESPLKECSELKINSSEFRWKYPMWYSKNIECVNTTLLETARSGIWYTDNITFKDSLIGAPKTFRRSKNITLLNTNMPLAQETMWSCDGIKMINVKACGDYLCMNSNNVYVENLHLDGNYFLDGASNIEIHNSYLNSKDAFWNCENVVVYDSKIIGEYLGWNSKNVTFINCEIESNQGLCYMDNLKLVNCKLINTDLCFELCSNIDADIKSSIISVKNPISGIINAESIDEIIFSNDMVDPKNTTIKVG